MHYSAFASRGCTLRSIPHWLALAVALVLAACSGSGQDAPNPLDSSQPDVGAALPGPQIAQLPVPISVPVVQVPEELEPQPEPQPELQSLKLVTVTAESVTATQASIVWTLDRVATGRVEYGLDDQYGSVTPGEDSLRYATHRQSLQNLQPTTTYHYRVRSTDRGGHEAVSGDHTFTTASVFTSPVPETGAAEHEKPSRPETPPEPDTPVEAETPAAPETPSVAETPVQPAVPDEPENPVEPETAVEPETPVEPEASSGSGRSASWPADADDRLMMGGAFYGVRKAGLITGNTSIALEHSMRFRAERTGNITAVKYNNRFLNNDNLNGRCKANDPNGFFCKCQRAGLDIYQCGYTLGSSYSVGNGGSIVFEVRPDDGTDNHWPASTVLGKTAVPFVPLDNQNVQYPSLDLVAPVYLEAGRLYHLVVRNLNPPDRCRLYRHPVEDAHNCPRDQGAISLNGTWHSVTSDDSHRWGPFLGDQGAGTLYRNSSDSRWVQSRDTIAWNEVRYDDGQWVGDSYAGYDNMNYGSQEGTKNVEGQNVARQIFKVIDATRRVDGLWLNYGHDYKRASITGGPLSLVLKNGAGATLATTSLPSDPECHRIARAADASNDRQGRFCRTWGYADLDTTVTLEKDQSYSLEVSADAGAAFALSTFFNVNTGDRNQWTEARAQYSTNGGQSWSDFVVGYRINRDLPVMFTIEGMPRRLP